MGERDEQIHGLGKYLISLVLGHILDGAAVVQTVRKLDEHHPGIIAEGQHDTLEILCLKAFVAAEHGFDLGQSVN